MEGASFWSQVALAQWLGCYGPGGDAVEIELKKMGIERIVSRHREEQERVEWEIREAHINREDYD